MAKYRVRRAALALLVCVAAYPSSSASAASITALKGADIVLILSTSPSDPSICLVRANVRNIQLPVGYIMGLVVQNASYNEEFAQLRPDGSVVVNPSVSSSLNMTTGPFALVQYGGGALTRQSGGPALYTIINTCNPAA